MDPPPKNEKIFFAVDKKTFTYTTPTTFDPMGNKKPGKDKLPMLRAKSFFYNEVPEVELYPVDKDQEIPNPQDPANPIECGRKFFLRYRGADDNTY